ncbi:MAG: dNTP triphosphohydrolase [Desulfuromonadaceae bacterium]|nr:dNTP triphosphohydrolase [Desulfuromonadaceae bacterium]
MPHRLQWEQLLSSKRVNQSQPAAPAHNPAERSEFESDYDRVVFSEPFRRLARKTQVHPLAPNDHIHNRLIHSIEVGSVGRSLGKKIQAFLLERHPQQPDRFRHIAQIVQVGCLVHDIGNPPFGHAGEFAIREWLAAHEQLIFGQRAGEATRADLKLFEGNAQGFRLAARKDNPQCGYMRLTYASLGSMIKYPWTSEDSRAQQKKKFNVFASEQEIFQDMAQEMGLALADGSVARHPLSFLTEAADDICYRMLDMEDAVSMRIFPAAPIKALFLTLAGATDTSMPIAMARGAAIGALIDEAVRVFKADYDAIMNGERTQDLKADFSGRFKEGFKEVGALYEDIFSHRAKLGYEIGSYKMVGRIIKAFALALQSLDDSDSCYDDLPFITRKCLELAWEKTYVENNRHESYDWWLRQAFDFISGLTDNYAIRISSEIEGILAP